MKKLIFLSLIIFPFLLNAQVNDDFTDGNITSSPVWEGDIASFQVSDPPTSGDGAINSDAGNDAFVLSSLPITSDAIITTVSNIAYGEWVFSVADGRNWSISNINDYKIILISDDNTVANLTDGTLDFNGYFLRFDGGEEDQFILYKQTGTTSEIIIDTDFPASLDGPVPLGRTIKITRSISGGWTVFIDDGFEIIPTTQYGITNDNTHTSCSYFGIATDIANPSAARLLYFDNLQITPLPTNDQTSQVNTGASTEPTSISSLIDTQGEAIFVFDFNFSDPASGDLLPTVIDQIQITQGTLNEISDWTNAIAGATITGPDISTPLQGSINAQEIIFSSNDFISIADGDNETYELNIWLNTDLSNISDNENLDFKLDYINIVADITGSSFGSGVVESGAESINITATSIIFNNTPNHVLINSDFTISVNAVDENNNTDTDFTGNVTLSLLSGTGTLSSITGLSQNFVSGEYTWNDLQYDTEEIFTLSASSSIGTVNSTEITCVSSIVYLDDDFEDGNLTNWQSANIERWQASTDDPINEIYSLKHIFDNPESDIDQISHPLSSVDFSGETKAWRFQLRYENSAPSGNNNWSVFLMADNDDTEMLPGGNINGYLIGINFSETDDIVKLCEITNGEATPVINTGFDWNNTNSSQAKGFEILRTSTGDWEVKIDEDGGFDNLTSYGTTNNSIYTNANYFGIYYKYSSSLDRKLWIDDVYFGVEIPDIEPPQVDTVIVNTPNTLLVIFNENVSQATAEIITNYIVNNSIGNPVSASLDGSDHKIVNLQFSDQFIENQENSITISNVEDENGNAVITVNKTFTWINIDAVSASATSDTTIDVIFSKEVDITTSQTLTNYTVNNAIGNPENATIDGSNNKLVHLEFTNSFVLEQDYILSVSNVQDTYGNIMANKDLNFTYYEVSPYDIIINEIMCDVNPAPEALPVHEYLELYNNSEYDINFTGWTLKIGDNSEKTFPAIVLPPGEYAIICEDDAESEFAIFGITIPILIPSELTVSGKRLLLKSNNGDIVEDLTYSDEWYDDDDKDGGGWSIERIDPLNFCGEDENWTATMDYTGGTPGRINSVYAVNPDLSSPEVTELEYISSKHIKVHFSEKVEIVSAETVENFTLNSTVNPTTAVISSEDGSIVNLNFTDNFNIGNNTVQIQNIEDNCNNIMQDFTGNFEYQLIFPGSVEVMSENQLRVHFSEKIEIISAQLPENYSVAGAIGNPDFAIISNSDSSIVNLQFSGSFILEQSYTLSISNVKDINENVMNPADIEFTYYIPKPFDIVINEIMCDINPAPTPLPEERYIELYNTSSFDLDLTNWTFLSEGQTERLFPYITLHYNDFLILCEAGKEDLFAQYGDVLPILTSSDITVSGRNLKLMTPDNTIIEELNYSDEWYDDDEHDNGGWSLERIDPLNFCGENDNWTVCTGDHGTPGQTNSVNASNQDNTAPELIDVHIVASNYLLLEFDENISYSSGSDTSNFSVNNSIGDPYLAYTDPEERTKVHLLFQNYFSDEQNYTLMVEGVKDNCDNEIQTTGFDFTYHLIYPVELWIKDEKRLKIKFSETVDLGTGTNILNYSCNNDVGNPEFAIRETADTTIIHLQFSEAFPDGEEITLSIENIKDINGNVMDNAEMIFTYYTPKAGDIVINEVLFNPFPYGVDFVEIYNRTQYDIDLINIQIAARDDENLDSIISISPLSETNLYIAPESYMAFTEKKDSVLRDYMSENQENLLEIENLPTFPDETGIVLIMYKTDTIIDEFSYHEDMHFKLLDGEGVSLERVNYDKETQEPSNWHSASELVGFATPAYKNSQFVEAGDPSNVPVNVEPYVFSPDNDGIDDYANINYKFQDPGHVATVYIFDAKGRIVKQLANNLLLSTEGTLVWDGLYADNRIANAGTYLVYFKVFDLNGTVNLYKKTVVLAKRI